MLPYRRFARFPFRRWIQLGELTVVLHSILSRSMLCLQLQHQSMARMNLLVHQDHLCLADATINSHIPDG